LEWEVLLSTFFLGSYSGVDEIIYRLGLGGFPQSFSSAYQQQKAIASKKLRSSPYLVKNIHGLGN
jgi:hypothetical protein